MREDGRVLVELQWGVTVAFLSSPLDAEGLWGRLQSVSLGGTSVPTLAPEDLLLLLCVHGAKHCWSRLAWICDVAELVRAHQELDWERVLEQASRGGGRRMLALGLRLAEDLLDAPLPAAVTARVQRERQVRSLVQQVYGQLFPEPQKLAQEFALSPVDGFRFNLRSRERLRDKLHVLALLTAPSAQDDALLPASGRLSFLRYALRPLRLLRRYGLTGS